MCVYGTFLHEMCRNNTQYRNVQKRIVNTTVGAYTHQISSQSEHYKKGHAEKNISPSEPRNQITYRSMDPKSLSSWSTDYSKVQKETANIILLVLI